MYRYRVNIEFENVEYSFVVESAFPLVGGEIRPFIATYMKTRKGIDISSGYKILSVVPN